MPGLYGIGSNVTVNSSNTTGLYAVANTGNVYSGNISSSNTTGLYIGAGTPTFLNNAELLLLLLDNNGNVNFALDPVTNNSTIYSYFVGSAGSTYSNANVAAFLPGYTGTLDNSTTIINLLANAGFQATSINVLNANLGAFEAYANATFSTGGGASYGNANVAAFLPFNVANVAGAYFIGDGSQLTNLPASTFYSNANVAAYLPTYTGSLALSSSIIGLTANAASQAIDIGTLFSNQTTLQGEIVAINANVVAANVNIATLNANLGAFETYVNATFSTSTYSNANVAAYLPIYTGTLANSSTIIDLYANAATQATNINTLFANAASQAVDINTLFANAASQAIDINTLFSNQTTLQGEIVATNANVVAANLNIATLFSNAAAQATSIDTINANVAAANLSIAVLDANVGAFETYANATFITSSSAYSNVNVAAYLPTYTGSLANSSTIVDLYANAATQATAIATVNANLGAYQTYANVTNETTQANIGTLFLGNASTNANLGAYQTYANVTNETTQANIGTLFLGNASTNANLGAFQTYVNATFSTSTYSNANVAAYLPTYTGTLALSSTIIDLYSNAATQAVAIDTLNANLGAYQIYANANIGTLFLGNASTNANLGAYQTWANLNFGPGGAGFYSNANVAAYLPVYGGNILATVTTALQPYVRRIGSNNTNLITEVIGGNNVIISANAGPSFSNAGGIIIVAGNEQVKTSGTFYAESSRFTFQSHNGNNDGNDPLDQMRMYVPTAVYGQFQQTSTEFGANTFSVYDGNVYIGPREHNISGSGILSVTNRILVNNGGVSLIGNTIATAGVITSGGNVSAPYFIGDGSQLTNLPSGGSYGNTQVAAFLPVYTGNIGNAGTTTGRRYIYSGNIDLKAGASEGTININAGSTANFSDGYTNIQSRYVSIGSTVSTALVEVFSPTTITQNNATTGNVLAVSGNIAVNPGGFGGGRVTARFFIGDGGLLTNVASGYGNTQVAAYLPTFAGSLGGTLTTAAQPNITSVGTLTSLTVTGNVSAGNVSGTNGTFTSVQGTLITAAQTNITSVGTLGAVTVTGAATVGNLITTNGVFWSNGVAYSTGGGGGTYGNTEVAAYLPTYTGSLAYTSQTGNVNYNNQYINNAILGVTIEKTSNLGVIQGTVTIDANIGPIQTAVVTANITINTTNITNMSVGESVTLVLTQNTNANLRILTSNLKYAGNSRTLSTANAAIDTISVTYDGTNYLAALVKGYA